MASNNQNQNVIFNALKSNSDCLVNRGFPALPDNAKVYKDVHLGGYGDIDILAMGVCKEDDVLEVNLYQIEDKTVSPSDILKMTNKLGGVSQWLERTCDKSDYRVGGFVIGPEFGDFLSYFLGYYINCYKMKLDALEGFKFEHHYHRAYSNLECKVLGVDIPSKRFSTAN